MNKILFLILMILNSCIVFCQSKTSKVLELDDNIVCYTFKKIDSIRVILVSTELITDDSTLTTFFDNSDANIPIQNKVIHKWLDKSQYEIDYSILVNAQKKCLKCNPEFNLNEIWYGGDDKDYTIVKSNHFYEGKYSFDPKGKVTFISDTNYLTIALSFSGFVASYDAMDFTNLDYNKTTFYVLINSFELKRLNKNQLLSPKEEPIYKEVNWILNYTNNN